MHVDLHQGCDLERSRKHARIKAPQLQIHHTEAVNLVCDDALDDHVWENERTISCQEAKVLEVLGYDVAVPCVVQWRMLWFSSPTSVNRRFLNSGIQRSYRPGDCDNLHCALSVVVLCARLTT